jgi:hypothetical protein
MEWRQYNSNGAHSGLDAIPAGAPKTNFAASSTWYAQPAQQSYGWLATPAAVIATRTWRRNALALQKSLDWRRPAHGL